MKNVKELYKKINNAQDLGWENFNVIINLPFKERLKLIKEMILKEPKTDFDFDKIEVLAKYNINDDYIETLATLKYTIKNLRVKEGTSYDTLREKLQDYQKEILRELQAKNVDYSYFMAIMANNYNKVMQEMINSKNIKGMMGSLHLYNQAMEVFLEAKDTSYILEIARKLSTLTFKNIESERLIIVTIKEFLMNQNEDKNSLVVPSSR